MIHSITLMVALPEAIVASIGLICLIAAAACGARVTRHIGWLVIAAFALAGFVIFSHWRLKFLLHGALPVFGFGTQFVDDSLTRFAKALVLGASTLSLLLSWNYFEKVDDEHAEYPVLVLFATLGMMLMISASDFLSLYVGLELQSLPLYVLAAIRRDDLKSTEAGLKYFTLGALSSGLLLYGISWIYGFVGTTDFVSVALMFRDHAAVHPGVVVGMVFICAALAFKLAAVPFHMWAPDVYEGAPTPVTAFFAAAPKLAAFMVLARFLWEPMNGLAPQWHQIIAFVAVASMLWGAFAGLVQSNLKRLMAYSSIATIGTLLLGILVGGHAGVPVVLIYITIYALNILGVFAVILCLYRDGKPAEQIADLSGLSKTNPVIALVMTVLMFSLAGVPPLAGFLGKYFIFLNAVNAGFLALAIIGVLSGVVTAYYYLRIVKVMYFDEPLGALDDKPDWGVKTVLAISSLAMIGLTIMPSPLINQTIKAAQGFIR